jgi:hypothetical protein
MLCSVPVFSDVQDSADPLQQVLPPTFVRLFLGKFAEFPAILG